MLFYIIYQFYILILQSEFWGKTGLLRFDEKGERSDIELEIHQVLSQSEWGSIQMVGTWTTREGLMWRGPNLDAENGQNVYIYNFLFLLRRYMLIVFSSSISIKSIYIGYPLANQNEEESESSWNKGSSMTMNAALRKRLRQSSLIITTVLV